MCGLVGVLNKKSFGFYKNQIDIFSSLLFLDLLRGDDSTGVFVATNKGGVALAKDATNSLEFLKTKEYGKLCSQALKDGIALVGHNRKATTGSITDTNAHPFVVEDKIVLVHNGTLYGDHKKIKEVEVDSHAIAHLLHENVSVEEAIEKVNGAYALIWYDVEKKQVNFLRNESRPLWWMETNNEYVWCSEKNMLDWIISRFELKTFENPVQLPEHTLNTFQWTNNEWDISNRKIKPKETYYKSAYSHSYHGALVECTPYETEGAIRTYPKGIFNPQDNISFEFESTLAINSNKLMSYSEFYKIKDTIPNNIQGIAFDYCYANQKNDEAGYHVYAYMVEHPNVIMRKWYGNKDISEENILQLVTGEYLMDCKINGQLEYCHLPGASKGGVQMGKALVRLSDMTCELHELH